MALFRPILGELNGSLANNVFAKTKGGLIVKRRAQPTNPQTQQQQLVRSYLQTMADRWNSVLTEQGRADWRAWASQQTHVNRLGESVTWSGQQEYVALGARNLRIGAPISDTIPDLPAPPPLKTITVSADAASGDIATVFTDSPVGATDKIVAYGVLNHSPGRMPLRSNAVFLGVSAAAAATPFTITYPGGLMEDLYVTVWLYVQDAFGQQSQPIQGRSIIAI